MFTYLPVVRAISLEPSFVFGGGSPSYGTTITRYTGRSCSNDAASLSTASGNGAASVVNNVSVIFRGLGSTTGTIESYDGTTRTTLTAEMAVAGASLLSQITASTLGGSAFIFGGLNFAATAYDWIQRFNGITRTTESATLAAPNVEASSTVVGSSVRILGGRVGGNPSSSIQSYNGSSRTTDAATLSYAVRSAAAGTYAGVAYIFGGLTEESPTGRVSSIQSYDGTTSSTVSAQLGASGSPVTHSDMSCAVRAEGVAIFGGSTGTGSGTAVNTIQVFNGTTNTVSSLALPAVSLDSMATTMSSQVVNL